MQKCIELIPDNDGYQLLVCPSCTVPFKLDGSELAGQEVNDLFCPVCGLTHEKIAFFAGTPQFQFEKKRMVEDILNSKLDSLFTRQNNRKGISFTRGRPFQLPSVDSASESEPMHAIKYVCCSRSAKIRQSISELDVYCAYCGIR
jgi:hypothetical protein